MAKPKLPVPEATRVITITIDATTADILGRLTGPQQHLCDAAREMITKRCAYLERKRLQAQLPVMASWYIDQATAEGFYTEDATVQKE